MCAASASCFGRKPRLLGTQTKHVLFVGHLKILLGLDGSFKLTIYPMLICVDFGSKNLHKLKGLKINIFLLFTHSGSLICRIQILKPATTINS